MELHQIEDLWISVVDRLPEKDDLYLCTIREEQHDPDTGKVLHVNYFVHIVPFRNNRFELVYAVNREHTRFVTDWMRLPLTNKRNDNISYLEEYSFATEIIHVRT